MWLGLAHFHNGYSFLMISPNLLDIWPVFFLILSRYETAHFLILLRPPAVGQQKIASAAQPVEQLGSQCHTKGSQKLGKQCYTKESQWNN
jgi:hypothetical protein